jgi:ATP-dependent RNA helicase RhlE|tara:strand:- start:76 stop:1431 length:1356 start_codon:yes stop_codon:yes gene_type:complete
MSGFEIFNLRKQLGNAIQDLGFESPTPIQEQSFKTVLSGKDILGIAQTGTGKTMAYALPILEELKFSDQVQPRVLILVPTRELVKQVCDELESLTKYMNVRILPIFGGVNINTQRIRVAEGCDIIVATPGRLYDLILSQTISTKSIKKLVIDEVDVMLDLGFRPQLMNIFELMNDKRQNIMFSATMTDEVEDLIDTFFVAPEKISIAVSGTPLDNIRQSSYIVENFYTKVNLLKYLLADTKTFKKVLVFVSSKRKADKVFSEMEEDFGKECGVIHSNKAQSTRFQTIDNFDKGYNRILIATDIIARGLDLNKISHVINFDTPAFPENYMHRIGRTGRAEEEGSSILFSTEAEVLAKSAIESLMDYTIPLLDFPKDVKIADRLLAEEQPDDYIDKNPTRNDRNVDKGASFHEKKDKNKKVNLGGSYKQNIGKKYKKAKTRGDKTYHKRKKMG